LPTEPRATWLETTITARGVSTALPFILSTAPKLGNSCEIDHQPNDQPDEQQKP
jgi:hypothetical protein